jgi:hypothetical protein
LLTGTSYYEGAASWNYQYWLGGTTSGDRLDVEFARFSISLLGPPRKKAAGVLGRNIRASDSELKRQRITTAFPHRLHRKISCFPANTPLTLRLKVWRCDHDEVVSEQWEVRQTL